MHFAFALAPSIFGSSLFNQRYQLMCAEIPSVIVFATHNDRDVFLAVYVEYCAKAMSRVIGGSRFHAYGVGVIIFIVGTEQIVGVIPRGFSAVKVGDRDFVR
jgi:hypothetical protein